MLKRLCLCISAVFFSLPARAESVPPAVKAPGGLDSSQIPLFITLGFDDNRYADGVDWVCEELFGGRTNPAGAGNPATFDGTPMRCDFFVIGNADFGWHDDAFTAPMPRERPATEAWKRACAAGFGVNNHTFTHRYNLYDLSYDTPVNERPSLLMEIGFCSRYLVNVAGIPLQEIFGFRTPNLAMSIDGSSLRVCAAMGMIYDCTMDNGVQGTVQQWAQPYFPGTMENGFQWPHYSAQNFWQIPNGTYPSSQGGAFAAKGFDSGATNGWPSGVSSEGMFDQMMWAIEFHYHRNRAPIDLGLHSDYYSQTAQNDPDASAGKFATGLEERRAALVRLLDHIQSTMPDARVVTKTDVIRWMRRPVALSDHSRAGELVFRTDNPSGILGGGIAVNSGAGSSARLNGQSVDVTVADAKNWKQESFAGVRYGLQRSLLNAHSVRIRYRSDLPLELRLEQSDLGEQSYCRGLPSTGSQMRTLELPVTTDHFMQPRPVSTEKPFNAAAVTAVSVFAAVLDTTLSGSFEAQVEFFGAGTLTDNTVAVAPIRHTSGSGYAITALRRGDVSLQVGLPGTYTIELRTPAGRLLARHSVILASGEHRVATGTRAQGCVVIRVSGPQGTIAQARTVH